MAHEWLDYIRKFDNLVEEALRCCVRNSLQTIFNVLHGDGTMGPSPLLLTDVDLYENDFKFTSIHFSPSFREISDFLKSLSNIVVDTLSLFPRLFEKFKLPTRSDLQPYDIVIKDDVEFGRLKNAIIDEVAYCQQQMFEYQSVWRQFESIWEVDKVEFMRRFDEDDANIYDQNINTHMETANEVQLQETITNAYFIDVNATKIKASVIAQIDEWKELYLEVLKKKAYDRITSRTRRDIFYK